MQPTKYKTALFGSALVFARFLEVVILLSIYPLLDTLGKNLNISDESFQQTIGLYFLGGLVGCIATSYIIHKFYKFPTIMISVITGIIGSVISSMSYTILMLNIGRILLGFSCGILLTIIPISIIDIFENRPLITIFKVKLTTPLLFASVGFAISLGNMITPSFSVFINNHFGWQMIFVITGILFAILGITTLLTKKVIKTEPIQEETYLKKLKNFYSPQVIICTIATTLPMLANTVAFVSLPILFIHLFKVTPEKFALLFTISVTARLLASLLLVLIPSLKQSKLVLKILLIAMPLSMLTIVCLSLAGIQNWMELFIAMCIINFCLAIIWPRLQNFLFASSKESIKITASFFQVTTLFMSWVGATIASFLDKNSLLQMSAITCIFLSVSAVLLLRILKKQNHDTN